jgi:hypothetical protein
MNHGTNPCLSAVKDSDEIVRRTFLARLTPGVPYDLMMSGDEDHRVLLLHEGTLP